MPYMLALAGQPSLHGYHACVVSWAKGAFWRNCRQNIRKTFFSFFWFFCVVETLLFGGVVRLRGIYGLVGPVILVPALLVSWWRSFKLLINFWMLLGS